jgi:hypothetical protein
MIGYARALFDDGRDAGQRPQICRKPMGPGALAERLVDARQLRRRQFRFPSGSPGAAQRGAPAAAPALIPAAHALPTHPQGASDLGHDLPGRKQARRLTAAQFQGMEVSAWGYMRVHAPIIRAGAWNVTLFYEIH